MNENDLFLEPGIAYELRTIQSDLAARGLLPSPERIRERATDFRQRFGSEALAGLEGEVLLRRLHGRDAEDDSLICRLEQASDDTVGALGGGSAFRGDLFFSRVRGGWIGGTPTDSRVLTLDEAIERARRHRGELTDAARAVGRAAKSGAAEDIAAYRALQAEIARAAPTVGDTAWGHKYLAQLFPDVLDPFHAPDVERHQLLRLLLAPPDDLRRARYAMAGLFAGVARALGVPMPHLGALLTVRHGRRPRGYWRVSAGASWEASLRDGYALLPESVASQVRPGDVAVATDAGSASAAVRGLGVVRASSGYAARDRVLVEWRSIEPWTLPVAERASRGLARRGENVREIERHLLADAAPFQTAPPVARAKRRGVVDVTLRVAEERGGYEARPARETPPAPSAAVPLPPLTGLTERIASVLARKGQVILHGPPGTGKTYGAEAAARELAARSWFGVAAARLTPAQASALMGEGGDAGWGLPMGGVVRLVCFHPAYGYEDFLEGYRPVAAEGSDDNLGAGSLRFERRDGIFKRLCRDAAAYPLGDFFLIVDEINRGDTPRIFGELMTALEPGKRGRHVLLPLSGESFAVPPNVFLIGTMNTTDRSIALLDAALRRRFGFVETPPDPLLLADVCIQGLPLAPWLVALNRRIRERLGADGRALQIGHAYFLHPDGTAIDDLPTLARVLREDIVPLIEEHAYEDPDLLEFLLGAEIVDARAGTVRDELFAHGREEDLRRALLAMPLNELTAEAAQ